MTSAEIVAATPGGRTLVYTDSPAAGSASSTSAARARPRLAARSTWAASRPASRPSASWALVAVNTSRELHGPSGELVFVDTSGSRVVRRIALAGQPDSVAISPDQRYAAIVIENERDEEVNDGLIPQLPAGSLQVLDLRDVAAARPSRSPGSPRSRPSDPEPEYVDINRRNQAVVSLQENNHLVIVDLAQAKVHPRTSRRAASRSRESTRPKRSSARRAQGLIELTDTITRRREPDAVHWIDDDTFATANEGDYEDEDGEEGGSRGFTLFDATAAGSSGSRARASSTRSCAPATTRRRGRRTRATSPRASRWRRSAAARSCSSAPSASNAVGVYDVSGTARREFLQMLPTGIGPEGHPRDPRARAARGLGGDRRRGRRVRDPLARDALRARPRPRRLSGHPARDEPRLPIPWVAISGLSGDPRDRDTLWAVSDSYLAQAYVYRIDVDARRPAVITERIPDRRRRRRRPGAGDFDLEGIAARREGGFWFASEGRTNVGSSRPEPARPRRRRGHRARRASRCRRPGRGRHEQRLRGRRP